jgi:hypothetical protein
MLAGALGADSGVAPRSTSPDDGVDVAEVGSSTPDGVSLLGSVELMTTSRAL